MYSKEIGDKAEKDAVALLKKSGYKILQKNYRVPFGEIDIIAKDKKVVVFVEVKMRSSEGFGLPQEFVDKRKRRKIIAAAISYIKANNIKNTDFRFDVVALGNALEKPKIIKSAFETAGNFTI
ncbi:MAG: YraN family protein [Endomicrobiales bacterium]|nr:YraN family protein [Endomicrobiales bacterium]